MSLLAKDKFLLALSIILIVTLTTQLTGALKCTCNVCPSADDFCETANHTESRCYKSFVKSLRENGSQYIEESYGCLSGGEGLLSHMQCHTNNLSHTIPKFIQCCKDSDFCNEFLPGPNEKEDPRWIIEEPQPVEEAIIKIYFNWQLKLTLGLLLLVVLCCLLRCIVVRIVLACSTSSKASRTSTCFLDSDLESKFHHDHHHHLHGAATSSSASTHSYSISDDLCHKPDPNSEDSFIAADLTSGLGERMLNQRTMARAIGSGQTDHVGNGRFGRVFRGQYHGEDVAVKAFRTIDQDSWKREDTIFRTLNHENIVRFIASEVTTVENSTTEIWMFLEYCPFGSLCDYLDHNEVLGQQQAVKILYSIINGLNYLHEDYAQASRLYKPSIAHRDIKSKNILMKTPDTCCIADFGHALVKLDEGTLDFGKYQHLQVGTVRYMAPEILRPRDFEDRLNYNHFSTFAQADLYQYGLIMWEVCHRTTLDVLHKAGEHKLPYDGVVPANPDIQDMIKVVCDDECRPPRDDKWNKYPIMKQLSYLMPECWRHKSWARMQTLGVKKKLKELYDQVMPSLNQQYLLNPYNDMSLSPKFRIYDKTRSSDVTL